MFKQILDMIAHKVDERLSEKMENVPELTKKKGIRVFNRLFLDNPRLQNMLCDFSV